MVKALDFTLSEAGNCWRVVCPLAAGTESRTKSSKGRVKETSQEATTIIHPGTPEVDILKPGKSSPETTGGLSLQGTQFL